MVRSSFIRIAATSVLVVTLGASTPGGEAYAFNKPIVDDPEGKLSATEYYSMLPFVVPIIYCDVHKRQLTLVLAIGMNDDGDRDELKRVAPRFRDANYRILFKLISFRTATPRVPSKSTLEQKLFPIVKKLGGDMIRSIKVHKSILGRRP
ncbi:MAG: hypothetical protein VX741_01000 [Pseudomonadota bacterium]|nr:hypothetical protein [Pseudomonadota bacterium]